MYHLNWLLVGEYLKIKSLAKKTFFQYRFHFLIVYFVSLMTKVFIFNGEKESVNEVGSGLRMKTLNSFQTSDDVYPGFFFGGGLMFFWSFFLFIYFFCFVLLAENYFFNLIISKFYSIIFASFLTCFIFVLANLFPTFRLEAILGKCPPFFLTFLLVK